MELTVEVKPEMNECAITTWTEMRRLDLAFGSHDGDERDDVNNILLLNMENMNKLESLYLSNYQKGASCVQYCRWQFFNVKRVEILLSRQVRKYGGIIC